MSESVREDWRNAADSKPCHGHWVAIGQAEDGSWELIDEHGKGLKVADRGLFAQLHFVIHILAILIC